MADPLPPDIDEIALPSSLKSPDAILGWHVGSFTMSLCYEPGAFIQHVKDEHAIAIAEAIVMSQRTVEIASSDWPGYLKFKVGARRAES